MEHIQHTSPVNPKFGATVGDNALATLRDINLVIDAITAIEEGTVSLTEVEVGDGLVTTPSMTFTSDLDTGIYHVSANNLGIATGGVKRVNVSSTGVDVIGAITATTTITATTSVITDTVAEKTAAAGVTIDGVLLKDGLLNRKSAPITSTGVIQTLPAGANDMLVLTSTTNTDLVRLSNSAINDAHILTVLYGAEAAGANVITLSKLNAGDGIGFTTVTFNAIGDTATFQWSTALSAWLILSVNGSVIA